MSCTVVWYKQSNVDVTEQFLGRRLTVEECWAKADAVLVSGPKAAERLTDHLRRSGCVARWEDGEPEGYFTGRRQ